MTGSTLTSTAKVPVGVTTITGYSTSLVLFLLAVYAYTAGDRSEQTLGTLAAGVAAALTFLATQIGRYVQAKAQIYATPTRDAYPVVSDTGSVVGSLNTNTVPSNPVSYVTNLPPMPYGTATPGVTPETPDGLPVDLDPNPPEAPNPAAARDVLDRTER